MLGLNIQVSNSSIGTGSIGALVIVFADTEKRVDSNRFGIAVL